MSGSYHLPELRDKIKRCIMGKRGRIDRDHSKTVISNCAVIRITARVRIKCDKRRDTDVTDLVRHEMLKQGSSVTCYSF